jgi:hypothetical protein
MTCIFLSLVFSFTYYTIDACIRVPHPRKSGGTDFEIALLRRWKDADSQLVMSDGEEGAVCRVYEAFQM